MEKRPPKKHTSDTSMEESGPKDPKDLVYNEAQGSYEFDVQDQDPNWDHPMDYNTIGEGAEGDDSTYDSANPYVGEEYANLDELEQEELSANHMRIRDDRDLKISKLDEALSHNTEDDRSDLDEEGYPINDAH